MEDAVLSAKTDKEKSRLEAVTLEEYEAVIKNFPNTVAAADTKEILAKNNVTVKPMPPEPVEPSKLNLVSGPKPPGDIEFIVPNANEVYTNPSVGTSPVVATSVSKDNTQYVRSYTRKDGTRVQGYFRHRR